MANKSPPNSGSGVGSSGMDFMLRTAREREASNKRKIRPKAIEDDLFPEDSDDSDFNIGSEEDSGEENSAQSSDSDEDDSDKEAESDADSSDKTGGDSDDDGAQKNKSTLRDALKKLNETASPVKPKKRKKPAAKKSKVKVGSEKKDGSPTKSESGTSKPKSGADSAITNGPSKNKKTGTPKSKTSKTTKSAGDEKSSKAKPKMKADSKKKKEKDRQNKSKSVFLRVNKLETLQSEARPEIDLDLRICSFCLGDKSDSSNEIIECDSCGVTVHEVCYGVSDNVSISSGTESSNSTEPWFCDACKSSGTTVICDLCPTKDGLFKETNTGRFVHLICAMYTPGVRVLDDGTPDLREVPFASWGNYLCAICDDERRARTGISIRCDAGFCKTYIHATCAQRFGFLSDPNAVDPANQIADPYYASCKLHSVKKLTRKRAESFGILQEQIRIRKEKKASDALTDLEKVEQSRIQKKIEKIRSKASEKFGSKKANPLQPFPLRVLNSGPIPVQTDSEAPKKSRLVDASTSVDRFLTKAALAGENVQSLELEDKHERIIANIGKKWNVLPGLTVEYAAYYADREVRVSSLIEQCDKLEQQKTELVDMHAGIKNAFESMCEEHKAEMDERDRLSKSLEQLQEILSFWSPNLKIDKAVIPSKRRLSGSPSRKSPAAKRDRRSPSSKRKSKTKLSPLNGSQSPSGRLRILRCDVCSNTDDQHLITKCDKCKRCFHLRCLDPPLTRMPKRTKSFGWMCSDCGDESEESDHQQVDTEAPRTLRGREKLKKPNKYLGTPPVPVVNSMNGSTKSAKSTPKEKLTASTVSSPKNSPSNSIHSNDVSASNSFTEGKCHTCSRDDYKKNMVMCDKCYREFHFVCLAPPLKYSPKRRGYSWFCANCDDASSGDSPEAVKIPVDGDQLPEI